MLSFYVIIHIFYYTFSFIVFRLCLSFCFVYYLVIVLCWFCEAKFCRSNQLLSNSGDFAADAPAEPLFRSRHPPGLEPAPSGLCLYWLKQQHKGGKCSLCLQKQVSLGKGEHPPVASVPGGSALSTAWVSYCRREPVVCQWNIVPPCIVLWFQLGVAAGIHKTCGKQLGANTKVARVLDQISWGFEQSTTFFASYNVHLSLAHLLAAHLLVAKEVTLI